jgi:hypothetical protein
MILNPSCHELGAHVDSNLEDPSSKQHQNWGQASVADQFDFGKAAAFIVNMAISKMKLEDKKNQYNTTETQPGVFKVTEKK